MSTAKLKEAVSGKIEHPLDKLRTQMLQNRASLAQLIGSQNVDVFTQVALNACVLRPELLDAYRPSFFSACRAAALDGLFPDGKEAVLNIYNTKMKTPKGDVWMPIVQYLPMVRGLIKLIWNTGHFTYIDAAAVYERDVFEFRRGDNPAIDHIPYAGDDEPGPIRAAYFVGKMKNGEVKREVMFRRDIEKARLSSKTPNTGPWPEWYDQMSIKTVIHRVWKQLPAAPEVDAVINRDAQAGQLGVEELLMLPETAGGEAPPVMTIPEDQKEPDPATQDAQPKAADKSRTNGAAKPAIDPGASERAAGAMTVVDALAFVGRGDVDMARDIARSLSKADQDRVEQAIVDAQPA